MLGLFKRKRNARPIVVVHLNARLEPMARYAAFEAPLDQWLQEAQLGEVCGGGTAFTPEDGVLSCDLELRVNAIDEQTVAALAERLDELGAPRGSKLVMQDTGFEMPIGVESGLALHLNGTDLPDEIYETTSLDELISMLAEALGDAGKVLGSHAGAANTSLYLYGRSNVAMRDAVAPVLQRYPLCQRAQLEEIA